MAPSFGFGRGPGEGAGGGGSAPPGTMVRTVPPSLPHTEARVTHEQMKKTDATALEQRSPKAVAAELDGTSKPVTEVKQPTGTPILGPNFEPAPLTPPGQPDEEEDEEEEEEEDDEDDAPTAVAQVAEKKDVLQEKKKQQQEEEEQENQERERKEREKKEQAEKDLKRQQEEEKRQQKEQEEKRKAKAAAAEAEATAEAAAASKREKQTAAEKSKQETDTPAPVVAEPKGAASKPVESVSPSPSSSASAFAALDQSDLDDSAFLCPADAPRRPCDWRWGPADSNSPNSEDHTFAKDVKHGSSEWKQPQDFYAFQAGMHVSPEGTGILVRVFMRDPCCTGPLPLSYFRIHAWGSAFAAVDPPLAIGPEPAAGGRGHHAVLRSGKQGQKWGGGDIRLPAGVDEERVLQTFLLLPDPGHYALQVRLSFFNVSADMSSENYAMQSRLYEERPGVFVDGFVRNARSGENKRRFFIPTEMAEATVPTKYEALPLCGTAAAAAASPEGEDLHGIGGVSPSSGRRFGPPLAGRWIFHHLEHDQPWMGYMRGMDVTQRPESMEPLKWGAWLVERSVYRPYFCRLDESVELHRVLERLGWVHFHGDSNARYLFQIFCKIANGTHRTSLSSSPELGYGVLKSLDPPELCIGPSDPSNARDADTGLAQGSASRFVITYTNWYWGKQQTLKQVPFVFGEQCKQWKPQNVSNFFPGWPFCHLLPPRIQSLSPGATYFLWGSHAAEFGDNPATAAHFASEDAMGLPYFSAHPTLFPLTTAGIPQWIPEKFGRQQIMRNNERMHASNRILMQVVRDNVKSGRYAPRTTTGADNHGKDGGGGGTNRNWLPLFDMFSPTNAAFEVLAQDAVHFKPFFSHNVPRWVLHYLWHAPNFGINRGEGAAAAAAAAEGAGGGN